jgi:ligand-binding SRPBCC domain-containing protein
MTQTYFEQDIFIEAPPERVRAFLAALTNHARIHPLIVTIDALGTTKTSDGIEIGHYKIRDRMRLGPFNLTFTYRVNQWLDAQGNWLSEAFQFPRIILRNTTHFLPEGSGTRLKEEIRIDTPRLLARFVFRQAHDSHHQMLLNLKKLLEA